MTYLLFVTFAGFLFGIHCGIVSLVVLLGGPVFLLLKKIQLARPERLKEVKHRKTPHPHEATRSANRRDFVTEPFVLYSFLVLHYFSSQR